MGRQDGVIDISVVVVGTLLIAGLSTVDAGRARAFGLEETFNFADLFGVRYLFIVLCAMLVALATFEFVTRGRAIIASVGYGFLFLVTVGWIAAAEGSAALGLNRLLGKTIRRATVNLGVTWAPWAAALLLLIIILACTGTLRPLLERLAPTREEGIWGKVRIGAGFLGLIGVALILIGRNSSAATVTFNDNRVPIHVEPWAVPLLGVGSLLTVFLIVTCLLLAVGRIQPVGAALVGAASCFIAAVVAGAVEATAMVIIQVDIVAFASRLADRLTDNFIDANLDLTDLYELTEGRGMVLMFIGAVLSGLSFATLVAVAEPKHV